MRIWSGPQHTVKKDIHHRTPTTSGGRSYDNNIYGGFESPNGGHQEYEASSVEADAVEGRTVVVQEVRRVPVVGKRCVPGARGRRMSVR